MLTSEESDELGEAASSSLQPKIKSEYPTEPTKDNEQNWTEESDQISEAASCPELLQEIRLEYTAQSTNDSEQNRPEEGDKIGDAAPNVELEYTGNAVESTNGFEQIWLEENYVIEETPVLPQGEQNKVTEQTIRMKKAESARRYRKNLKEQLQSDNIEKCRLAEKRIRENIERCKRYREKIKTHPDLYAKLKDDTSERVKAHRLRQRLKRLQSKNDEEISQLSSSSQESTVTSQHVQMHEQNRPKENGIRLINAKKFRDIVKANSQSTDNAASYLALLSQQNKLDNTIQSTNDREQKKSDDKHVPLTADAERTRACRIRKKRIISNGKRAPLTGAERMRAYRIRQKLKRLQSENGQEISQLSSSSRESTVTNQHANQSVVECKKYREKSEAQSQTHKQNRLKEHGIRLTNAEKFREIIQTNSVNGQCCNISFAYVTTN